MEEFGKSNPRLAPVLYITTVYLYERCIREINAGFYSSQSLALEKFIEKISSAFVVRFFFKFPPWCHVLSGFNPFAPL